MDTIIKYIIDFDTINFIVNIKDSILDFKDDVLYFLDEYKGVLVILIMIIVIAIIVAVAVALLNNLIDIVDYNMTKIISGYN